MKKSKKPFDSKKCTPMKPLAPTTGKGKTVKGAGIPDIGY